MHFNIFSYISRYLFVKAMLVAQNELSITNIAIFMNIKLNINVV